MTPSDDLHESENHSTRTDVTAVPVMQPVGRNRGESSDNGACRNPGAGADRDLTIFLPTGRRPPQLIRRLCVVFALLLAVDSAAVFADWATNITCPEGRVYNDEQEFPVRFQSCELQLPGGLKVLDGPFLTWFAGATAEGVYQTGRRVGVWKTCEINGGCDQHTMQVLSEFEQRWGTERAEIPIRYWRGSFIFDFASCWGTQVTQATDTVSSTLIFVKEPFHCTIVYFASSRSNVVGYDEYACRVPSAVGIRVLKSVDVQRELQALGFPQFCSRGSDRALIVDALLPLLLPTETEERLEYFTIATQTDVESSTVERAPGGPTVVTIVFNRYATNLVRDAIAREPTRNYICNQSAEQTATSIGDDGRRFFTYTVEPPIEHEWRYQECIAAFERPFR
jgi:hypothetical protein